MVAQVTQHVLFQDSHDYALLFTLSILMFHGTKNVLDMDYVVRFFSA